MGAEREEPPHSGGPCGGLWCGGGVCAACLLAGVGYPAFDVVLAFDGLLLHAFGFGYAVELGEHGDEVATTCGYESVGEAFGVQVFDTFCGGGLVAVATDDDVVAFFEGLRCGGSLGLWHFDFGSLGLWHFDLDGVGGDGCGSWRGGFDLLRGEEEFVDWVVLEEYEEQEPEDEEQEEDYEGDNEGFVVVVFLEVGGDCPCCGGGLWGRVGGWLGFWLGRVLWFWLGCGDGVAWAEYVDVAVFVAVEGAYSVDGDGLSVLEGVVVVVDVGGDKGPGIVFGDVFVGHYGVDELTVVEVEITVEVEELGLVA